MDEVRDWVSETFSDMANTYFDLVMTKVCPIVVSVLALRYARAWQQLLGVKGRKPTNFCCKTSFVDMILTNTHQQLGVALRSHWWRLDGRVRSCSSTGATSSCAANPHPSTSLKCDFNPAHISHHKCLTIQGLHLAGVL